ncbi:MAG: Asp23/Gls24 family envelope stress response protein [Clostridium sp.]|nr:Asp23/Gls24 family envelope stress response protein [Clostridium sp.]
MKANITTEIGNVYYSEDVIANIAGVSTMECYGVVGMALKNASDGFWELIKGENLAKGVKITQKDNGIAIELYIIVEYGTKIAVIANNIIQTVRYNLENLTGIKVLNVTVNVQGIRV